MNDTATGEEMVCRQQDQLRAGAVRGHPRRGQGQGGAGRASTTWCSTTARASPASRSGASAWAARSRLHGASAILRRCARSVDAGLCAHRLRRPRQRQALSLLLARRAASASSTRLEAQGLTLYTGIEPEFMLLKRDGRRQARAVRRHRHARQALLRLQGPVARQRDSSRSWSTRMRAVGIDVYQIDHEDAQRPVRGQLHLRRRADLRRPLHASSRWRLARSRASSA